MPDKYTTREDREDEDRRQNDPCYYGHDFQEVSRRTKTDVWYKEEIRGGCSCRGDGDDGGSYSCVCGAGDTISIRQESKSVVIKFRCSRCKETDESERSI